MSSRRQMRVSVVAAVIAVGALTAASLRSAGNEPYSGKEWAAPGGDWGSTRAGMAESIWLVSKGTEGLVSLTPLFGSDYNSRPLHERRGGGRRVVSRAA